MHLIGKTVVSIRDFNSVPGEDSAAAMMTHLLGHPLFFPDPSQHGLQNGLDFSLLSTVKAGSSLRDQARLSTLSAPHSSSWLRAFPNPKVGLPMIREEFTKGSKIWLGLPFFSSQSCNLRCIFGHVLDKYLDHLLSCGKRFLRTKRHNAYETCHFSIQSLIHSDCKIEQGCSLNNYKKPGDLFHSDFSDGRSAFFDITVRKSLLPRFIAIAATHPGQAADAGEREKDLKHDDDVLQAGSQFFSTGCGNSWIVVSSKFGNFESYCQECCLPPQPYYQPVCVPATRTVICVSVEI